MNDGRFSVTGLVTETNALINSYRYDPYGNLVSGTADVVNYYGYNAESIDEKAVDNVKKTAKKTYQKAVSAGFRFVQSVGNGIKSAGRKLTKIYTSFKSYVAERTAEIKETVVRELCTTANRITDALGKVDWKSIGKIAVGGLVIAGLGVATVLTGGTAAVIAAGAFSGAIAGGGAGAVIGGISSAANGDGFLKGAAEGFLWGTIGGAVSGGVSAGTAGATSSLVNNKVVKAGIENAADTLVNTVDDVAHGRDVSLESVAKDFGMGMVSSAIDTKKASATSNLTDSTKKTPNPYGKAGGEAHRNKIAEIQPTKGGEIKTEHRYITPGGQKNSRYADAVEVVDNKVVNIYQVGKVSKNGLPVSRESKAISDIMEHGKEYNGAPITFIPYNSEQGPIIYTP